MLEENFGVNIKMDEFKEEYKDYLDTLFDEKF